MIHIAEVSYTKDKNEFLEKNFKEFWKLKGSPKIKKKVFVLKDTLTKPKPSRVESEIEFEFPSFRKIILHEYLTEPEGLTSFVQVKDFQVIGNGNEVGWSERMLKGRGAYLEAETFVKEEFEKEINVSIVV